MEDNDTTRVCNQFFTLSTSHQIIKEGLWGKEKVRKHGTIDRRLLSILQNKKEIKKIPNSWREGEQGPWDRVWRGSNGWTLEIYKCTFTIHSTLRIIDDLYWEGLFSLKSNLPHLPVPEPS